jgi:hypothetical protein
MTTNSALDGAFAKALEEIANARLRIPGKLDSDSSDDLKTLESVALHVAYFTADIMRELVAAAGCSDAEADRASHSLVDAVLDYTSGAIGGAANKAEAREEDEAAERAYNAPRRRLFPIHPYSTLNGAQQGIATRGRL